MILVLALLIFGPKRLPEVGRTIGKGLAEFRRATTDLKRSVNAELSLEDAERSETSRRPPIEGVGRTVAEASTTRELPEAPAAEEAAEATEASLDAAASAGPTADAEAEPTPTVTEGPAGTEPRGAVGDAPNGDGESSAAETSRTTING